MTGPRVGGDGDPLRILLVGVLLGLLIAPLASAQSTPASFLSPSLELRVAPADGPVGEDVSWIPVDGVYTATAPVALTQTQIVLEVEGAPDWLHVVIEPSTVFVNTMAAPGLTASVPFYARLVVAASAAPAGAIGQVKVVAYALPNGAQAGAAAATETLVKAAGHDHDECPEHAAANATAAPAEAPKAATVETASVGAVPASGPVVGGLALVGAVAGGAYVLRRKG